MSNLIKGKATICIVNYKTQEFTRLCLRSIRKFTKYPYEVIVVDIQMCQEWILGVGDFFDMKKCLFDWIGYGNSSIQ